MEIPPAGVRKGTWSKEEDDLLRACIQRYGEGKWRLVPQRAGLNRCRKSCRLRWMNYLKPEIKRGSFTEDEADMIMRFQRLLGNRWSLIAARFPGRTSNDVKNYWNTNIRKRLQCSSSSSSSQEATMKTQKVIRPQPLSFSRKKRKGLLLVDKSDCRDKPVIATDSDSGDVAVVVGADSSAKESEKEWWQGLLDDVIVNKASNEEDSLWRLGGEEQDKFLLPQFWDDHNDQQQFHFFQ